jgi:hypothetical protein
MTTKLIVQVVGALVGSLATLPADQRESANYSILADTLDAGGQRITSANYTIDTSLSPVTGISETAAPAEIAKNGYVGQLFDITGLVVAAAQPEVAETASVQLVARYQLDDATFLAIAPNTVTWQILSGPIASIAADGIATTAAVYEDTPATASGTLGTLSGTLALTVLNTIPDNYGSYAGDAIDDAWQIRYFGLDNPLAAPDLDPDGDGETNLFEFIAGVDPTDPNSHFRFRIESVPGEPAQKNLIFSPRLEDRTYTALSAETLSAAAFAPLPSFSITDNGDERTLTDLNATVPAKFYRIGISKP